MFTIYWQYRHRKGGEKDMRQLAKAADVNITLRNQMKAQMISGALES